LFKEDKVSLNKTACLAELTLKIWLQKACHSSTEVSMPPRAALLSLRFLVLFLAILFDMDSKGPVRLRTGPFFYFV